ncbi:hypothetical protein OKA05_20245 [Luteolibacter arcticus]|uniref:DUF3592 domain-containing protein n=1 Tax=Luteolibacter arcticus TaxID=1581411 RepID=A0ABT3GN59_9BACT|nr:hypothetical protein [Luteolibacter arcticus]MCW1924905.1 hypothetical protein [Luteolibacter arcticus]
MLFLVWSWWDSAKMDRARSWTAGRFGSFRVNHADSAISLTRAPHGSPSAFVNDRWSFSREFAYTKERTYELDSSLRWPAVKIGRDEQGRPLVVVPYWVSISIYLSAWACLLAWCRRRHSRNLFHTGVDSEGMGDR